MKKIFLLAVAAVAFCACNNNNVPEGGYLVNVTITGDMTQLKSDTLILTNNAKEDVLADTVMLSKGQAKFTGMLDTPQPVMLLVKNGEQVERLCGFFLETGKTDVNIALVENERPDVKIKGGAFQTASDSLVAFRNELFKKANMDSLMRAYNTATEEAKGEIRSLYDSLSSKVDKVKEEYIQNHPASLFAFHDLMNNVGDMDIAEAEAKLATFKALPEYANNKNIAKVEKIIATIKALQPGMPAPNFTQNDPEGKPVTFSEIYKNNKVTMIDFWASWCSPCRAFNPELVKIYKEFHKKGFEILGVSLDRDQDSWVKAIKDDGLVWPQVSDLGYWNNEVAKQYYVRFIPQNIFVDQNGTILKRQASEEEIVELLKANL